VEVPAGPTAPREARSSLQPLRDVLPEEVLDALRLIVSELVTNSVKHATLLPDAAISVWVHIGAGVVRLEVADHSGGFPLDVSPGREGGESGWGLFIVNRLADRWGAGSEDGIWVEIDLAERAPSAGRNTAPRA
jgi:two-component sensor histidine kinase